MKVLYTRYCLTMLALTSIIEGGQFASVDLIPKPLSYSYVSYSTQGVNTGLLPVTARPEYPDMCDQSENFKKLNEFAEYPNDWNGYGATPFSKDLIDRIRQLLFDLPVQPEIFPTARSSIQLEYDVGENHIEIEVSSDDVNIMIMKGIGSFTHDSFPYDENAIREAVDRFYANISV